MYRMLRNTPAATPPTGRAPWKRNSSSRRRGAAMTECVLVLPVIMLLVALVLMLGRASTRLQHVSVVDRYEAWRDAVDAPGPAAGVDGNALNEALLNGAASELDVTRTGEFPTEPGQMLIEAAGAESSETGSFAQQVLDRFPNGRHVSVNASYEATIPLETRLGLASNLRASHTRLANEWKHANGLRYNEEEGRWEPDAPYVSMRQPVRDTYLRNLDEQLPRDSNVVASSIRAMYMANPGYRGPYLQDVSVP